MGQYLKSYRVILTTKSPVYVGSGEKNKEKTICSESKRKKDLFAGHEKGIQRNAEKEKGTSL